MLLRVTATVCLVQPLAVMNMLSLIRLNIDVIQCIACRYAEALSDFSQAVAIDPQGALSYNARALLLERLGRPDQVRPPLLCSPLNVLQARACC